jgi:hypothetical protein
MGSLGDVSAGEMYPVRMMTKWAGFLMSYYPFADSILSGNFSAFEQGIEIG